MDDPLVLTDPPSGLCEVWGGRSLSPPCPTPAQGPGQRRSTFGKSSPFSTSLPSVAADSPAREPSAQWIEPARAHTLPWSLKQPGSGSWTLGQGPVAPKTKAASASLFTSEGVSAARSPDQSRFTERTPASCCRHCVSKRIGMWLVAGASDGRGRRSRAPTKPSSGEGLSDFRVLSSLASPPSPAAFGSVREQALTQGVPRALGPECGASPDPAHRLAREDRQ